MTYTLRRSPQLTQRLLWMALCGAALLATGCSESGNGNEAPACTPGTAACTCTADMSCDTGLECFNNFCIPSEDSNNDVNNDQNNDLNNDQNNDANNDVAGCDAEPCQNDGTCTDGENGAFTCECAEGFEGDTCETNIDDCADEPCLNDGTCIDGIAEFTCECPEGFEGDTCDTNIDDCADEPCQNGGTCTDGVAEFTCECPEGFEGDTCQTDIDDCAGDPCQNGGTCTDGVAGFTCECVEGFEGDTCDTNIDDCADDPCLNDGTCIDGVAAFTCDCAEGFEGDTCEVNIDDCAGDPCQNGGTCTDGVAEFTCECAEGYEGDTCQTDINECEDDPCQNGGTCTDLVGLFECDCVEGFEGDTCEVNIDDCEGNDACQNGATCVDGVADFTCDCADGFEGNLCETNIDDCEGNDACQNGGTCVDGIDDFTCDCAEGFEGDLCEVNIDECEGDPCENGGTCIDGIADFTCECPEGFGGLLCESCIGGPGLADADQDGLADICDTLCPNDPLNDQDNDGICDSDDPCPGIADDGLDSDGDGLGNACDCAPTDPLIPSAEICDGVDNDCDGDTDEFGDLGGALCILVNTTEDPLVSDARVQDCVFGQGSCSLRAALAVGEETDNDTIIRLPSGTYTNTQGESWAFSAGYDTTVLGSGAQNTFIDGDGTGAGFRLAERQHTTIEDLTIQNILGTPVHNFNHHGAIMRRLRFFNNIHNTSANDQRSVAINLVSQEQEDQGDVVIEDCLFEDNISNVTTSSSYVIRVEADNATLQNLIVRNNTPRTSMVSVAAENDVIYHNNNVTGVPEKGGVSINAGKKLIITQSQIQEIGGGTALSLRIRNIDPIPSELLVEDVLIANGAGGLSLFSFNTELDARFNRISIINNHLAGEQAPLIYVTSGDNTLGELELDSIVFSNMTVSDNSALGIFRYNAHVANTNTILDHVTIVDNDVHTVLYSAGTFEVTGGFVLRNSIVAGNTNGGPEFVNTHPNPDFFFTPYALTSAGGNILGAIDGLPAVTSRDMAGSVQNPITGIVSGLVQPPGELPYVELAPNSPAIDFVRTDAITELEDQLGHNRPINLTGTNSAQSDAGAVEMLCSGNTDSDNDGIPDECDFVDARGTTFTPDVTEDSSDLLRGDGLCRDRNGNCSLRAAIEETLALDGRGGPVTIVLGAQTYTLGQRRQQGTDFGGRLTVRTPLNVIGAGIDQTIIDGDGQDRIFDVTDTGDLFVEGLTLTGGRGVNFCGDLRFSGGELACVTGKAEFKSVRLHDTAQSHAHLIIVTTGADLVLDELVATDLPNHNGIIGAFSSARNGTFVELKNSLIANNAGRRPAIFAQGPTAAPFIFVRFRAHNNTIVGNTNTTGDFLASAIYMAIGSTPEIFHNTIVDNHIESDGEYAAGGVHLNYRVNGFVAGNVVAGNTRTGDVIADFACADCATTSQGGNFIGVFRIGRNFFGNLFEEPGDDLIGTEEEPLEPALGPLADNGGPLPTMLPLPGSPLIDAAIERSDAPQDARGFQRGIDGNGDGVSGTDIGAVELIP